jgi:hypothetical protein
LQVTGSKRENRFQEDAEELISAARIEPQALKRGWF